jgi:hypothetical protein
LLQWDPEGVTEVLAYGRGKKLVPEVTGDRRGVLEVNDQRHPAVSPRIELPPH